MPRQIRAAAVQFNIKPGAIQINLAKAAEGLRRAAQQGAQLAVLPEMWSCAYDFRHMTALAEQTPQVLEHWQQTCRDTGLVSVGSLPEIAGEKIYNTAYVIDCGEVIGRYRKLHLFSTMIALHRRRLRKE